MTKTRSLTQYFVGASLDGFIADENENLDWLLQFEGDDANPYDEFIQGVGAAAMGATTYEWVQRHDPESWKRMGLPTWVFTHRDLPVMEGAGVTLTHEDVPTVHAQMVEAAAGKNVWLIGGGDLVGQFLDHDLLDELWLSLAPVTLGKGAALLPRRRTEPMRLESVTPAPNGTFVHLRYSLR